MPYFNDEDIASVSSHWSQFDDIVDRYILITNKPGMIPGQKRFVIFDKLHNVEIFASNSIREAKNKLLPIRETKIIYNSKAKIYRSK